MSIPLQKTKIPARGLKRGITTVCIGYRRIRPSKNQNPREGIETRSPSVCARPRTGSSKNQNPREGIETLSTARLTIPCSLLLQKTKIPARGLKHYVFELPNYKVHLRRLQKTKIPARGLKRTFLFSFLVWLLVWPSKNQNPREGIETTQCAAQTAQ